MSRAHDFAAFVAARWPTPESALSEFFDGAVAAAAEVGAKLIRARVLDGRRTYLPALGGRRDQKQFVRGSVQTMDDGTRWPSLTFFSFRDGSRSVFWSPRDDAWRLYREECASGRHVDADPARAAALRAEYAQRAAQAQAEAERAAAADALRDREAHTAAAEAARMAWEAGAPAEVAGQDYLRRKRLAGHGLRVATTDMCARLYSVRAGRWLDRATVVRAGDLLIPMRDADGALVNLERIAAPDGSKRGIAGGQRVGTFYVIPGTGPDARRIVCEGWATGAAWHAATGDAVAVAFSAGNLPTVAAAFGAQFVAADHDRKGAGERAAQATGLPYAIPATIGDWWDVWSQEGAEPLREAARVAIAAASVAAYVEPWKLPAPELKGRAATWWNKLAKASDPEQAAALGWAIAARLSARIPCADDVGKLRDRITATAPAEVMNPRTMAAIRDGIARRIEWRKRRALSALRTSPEALRRHRVEVVDELPELRPEEYRGVILIAAPMAAGKTQRIGIPFAQWATHEGAGFLALAHRRSLIAELARRLGVEHYEQVDAESAPFVSTMATCVNSLTSPAHAGIIQRAAFVFIDEISQVLRAIASETTVAGKRSRGDMLEALRRLVAEAECLIGADAGLCDRALRFVETCRPGERARVIVVPARDEGLRATFGVGADALATAYGEALARLSEGERLWIACSEASRARECAALFESHGHRVLLLEGANRDGAEQSAFWTDPERVSRQYAAVVASPVVSSGMSIEHRDDGAHFDRVFWLGSGARVTPADALQQMRRVRYVRGFTVAVVPNNAHDIDDANAILHGMGDAADVAGALNPVPAEIDEFVAEIDAADARARADFAAGLFWAMEAAGFKVERAGDAGDGDGDGDEGDDAEQGAAVTAELTALRARLREERIDRILAARVIDLAEAMRLRDRPNRSEADAAALDRWWIAEALGIEPADVDRQAIEDHDDGRGPRQWDRWSAAVLGVGDVRTEQVELSRRRFPRARVAAYARLFDGFDLRPATRFTPDDAAEIIRRVIRDRHMLAFLRLIPARYGRAAEPKPSERPMRELGDILALMGLKLRRREGTATPTRGVTPLGDNGASGGGSARNRFHEIDAATWDRVASLAERRNAAKSHAADLRKVGPVEAALRRVGSTALHAADIMGACLSHMHAYRSQPQFLAAGK